MTILCSDFEAPAAVDFGPAERRLLNRYVGRLAALDRAGRVPPARLYYAAASAVECLRFGRSDARACQAAGGSPAEVSRVLETGRTDALFYLELARAWIEGPDPCGRDLRLAG